MTKYEYLAKLEQLLSAMPQQERRDALDYYAEYFDAAGPDHEAETAEKLGDPETVARKILEGEGLTGEENTTEETSSAAPADGKIPPEDPAAGPVTRTGLHGPGLLALFVVILLLVALALALSAGHSVSGALAATGKFPPPAALLRRRPRSPPPKCRYLNPLSPRHRSLPPWMTVRRRCRRPPTGKPRMT